MRSTSPLFCVKSLCGCVLAVGSATLLAQSLISADNLTPFQPRDVGSTSEGKTVRIKLNAARALTSIALAPGFTEFNLGAISDCVVDGHTVNPGLSVCSVDVTFEPKYPGVRTAPLIVTDSTGKKASIGLVGTGLAPQASLTPGIITSVAGNGQTGESGDGGPALDAELFEPRNMTIDAAGNYYFCEPYEHRVRKVSRDGTITTVAGTGSQYFGGGDGGPATSATLNVPSGVALDAAGNLYIADTYHNRIRKVDLNGIITTVAGNGAQSYSGDGGPATSARLNLPADVAVDAAGNLYIADQFNNRIRKVDTNGIITTIAGTGHESFAGDGGPATSAYLDNPRGIAVDAAGNVYFAELWNYRVRKVDTNGIITTLAGSGPHGGTQAPSNCVGDGGLATKAGLGEVDGVAVDAAGNVYINDIWCNRVRRVDTNGTITTVIGDGFGNNTGENIPATQTSVGTSGIALDGTGNIYLVDGKIDRIRKVDVSQSAVSFASQNVGTVSPAQTVVVTNTGNQHVDLTNLNLTGEFALQSGTERDCSDTSDLGAGFSCAFRLTFNPTNAGALTGSVTLTDNALNSPGTTQTISLTGTAVTP